MAADANALMDQLFDGMDEYRRACEEEGFDDAESIFGLSMDELEELCENAKMKKGHALKFKKRHEALKMSFRSVATTVKLRPPAENLDIIIKPNWYSAGEFAEMEQRSSMKAILQGTFQGMNIGDAVGQIGNCAGQLRLALMAAGGHKCNKPILALISKYHCVCGDAIISTNQMVSKSLQALKYHKIALEDFDAARYSAGKAAFFQVAALAGGLCESTGRICGQMNQLHQDAVVALQETQESANTTRMNLEEEKKANDSIKQLLEQTRSKQATRGGQAEIAERFRDENEKAVQLHKQEARNTLAEMEERAEQHNQEHLQEAKSFHDQRRQNMNALDAGINEAREACRLAEQNAQDANDTYLLVDGMRTFGTILSLGLWRSQQWKEGKEAKRRAQLAMEDAEAAASKRDEEVKAIHENSRVAQQAAAESRSEAQKIELVGKQKKTEKEFEHASQRAEMVREKQKEMEEALTDELKLRQEVDLLCKQIMSGKEGENEVGKAVAALGMCTKTIGLVVAVFKNCHIFWSSVRDKSEELIGLQTQAELMTGRAELERVRDTIFESGKCWAAMGVLCFRSSQHLQLVMRKADACMTDLPTGDERFEKIRAEAMKIGIANQSDIEDMERRKIERTKQLTDSIVY